MVSEKTFRDACVKAETAVIAMGSLAQDIELPRDLRERADELSYEFAAIQIECLRRSVLAANLASI